MRQRARHITSNSVLTPHTSSNKFSAKFGHEVRGGEVEGSKVTNFTGVPKMFEFYLPN